MKSVRVVLAVVALLALPFGAVAAQNRSNNKGAVRSAEVVTDCKDQQAASLGRATDAGRAAPYGLDKKCSDPVPPPPPPPASPPTGMHSSTGIVYEDVDGSGSVDFFLGDMPFAGWTVQLYWNGQLVTSTTTDADGKYLFPNIGPSDLWAVCVIPQAGYNRTQPVNGNACGGNGVTFNMPDNSFRTEAQNNFGWMMP
jgi:hypothetical protein